MLCGLAPTVPAKAQTYESFKTPTGNIICIMNDTDVECGIKSGLNPAPPKQACTDGDPVFNRVDLQASGIAEPLRCAGDPGAFAEEPNAKVLAYGAALIKGETAAPRSSSALSARTAKATASFSAAQRYDISDPSFRGSPQAEPGIHNHRRALLSGKADRAAKSKQLWLWIPGSRFARPGMTKVGTLYARYAVFPVPR